MHTKFLSHDQKYLPGIYGGVGPLSHIEFERILLEENYARGGRKDQDHPAWVLVNASSTPDRTKSLATESHDSLPYLQHFAKLLENSGADFMVVICNTAHTYHGHVQKHISIPWVHIMDCVAKNITTTYPSIKRVGVLATDGTLQNKLYEKALTDNNLTAIVPKIGSDTQNKVMDAIYHRDFGIKATGAHVDPKAVLYLVEAAKWCLENGAEAIIAGCTEISVGLTEKIFPFAPIVDPLHVLAQTTLDIAYGHKKPQDFMLK